MQENKSLVQEALIQMKNVEEAIAENAKGILASTMKEEINQLVKESLSEQEEEDEVEEEHRGQLSGIRDLPLVQVHDLLRRRCGIGIMGDHSSTGAVGADHVGPDVVHQIGIRSDNVHTS